MLRTRPTGARALKGVRAIRMQNDGLSTGCRPPPWPQGYSEYSHGLCTGCRPPPPTSARARSARPGAFRWARRVRRAYNRGFARAPRTQQRALNFARKARAPSAISGCPRCWYAVPAFRHASSSVGASFAALSNDAAASAICGSRAGAIPCSNAARGRALHEAVVRAMPLRHRIQLTPRSRARAVAVSASAAVPHRPALPFAAT